MDRSALHGRQLLAAVVFVAAVFVLAVQLITPSPVMVSVGGDAAEATRLGEYFTYGDVAVVAAASCVLGASGTYILLGGAERSAFRRSASRNDNPERTRTPGDAVPGTEGAEATAAADEPDSTALEDWEAVADRLRDNESVVFETVLDAGGEIPQRRVVEETDLSKATVSRTLDTLETRGLVERRRRGMGNVITLQEGDETRFTRV